MAPDNIEYSECQSEYSILIVKYFYCKPQQRANSSMLAAGSFNLVLCTNYKKLIRQGLRVKPVKKESTIIPQTTFIKELMAGLCAGMIMIKRNNSTVPYFPPWCHFDRRKISYTGSNIH